MVQKKRIMAGILGLLLACGQPAGVAAQTIKDAADTGRQVLQEADTQQPALPEDLQADAKQPVSSGDLQADTKQPVSPGDLQADTKQPASSGDLQPDAQQPVLPEDLKPDYNDPDYVKHLILKEEQPEETPTPFSIKSAGAKKTVSPFTGLTYVHASQVSGSTIVHGIDVSEWQATIDWKKVKKAGVEFAFIRCGYTSLSSSFLMHEDDYFRKNIEGAYNAGVQIGIYYFSNSITASEAKKEAQKTLELIAPYQKMITLPVVYDFEAFSNSYRAYGLTKSKVTSNAKTYLDIIQKAGYTPMYYSSPNFLANQFNVNEMVGYNFWLAHYTTQTTFTGNFMYWQYSSSGRVNGISGNVDCDFYYSHPSGPQGPGELIDPDDKTDELDDVTGLTMTDNSTTSIEIEWDEVEGAQGYKVYRSPALGGTYKQIQVVSGSAITTHLDTKVAESEGRQYYYKVVPFLMEDDEVKYGGESDVLIANTDCVYKHRLKTKANLNLREQAGTEYATLTVVPAGTVLGFKRFTFSTTGKRWYKVTYKKNGQSYTGYISGSYIKKYTYGTASKKANLRNGAGKSYKLKNIVHKGTDLTILKNKESELGVPWSRVTFEYKGKDYKGYMKTKFIKRY